MSETERRENESDGPFLRSKRGASFMQKGHLSSTHTEYVSAAPECYSYISDQTRILVEAKIHVVVREQKESISVRALQERLSKIKQENVSWLPLIY